MIEINLSPSKKDNPLASFGGLNLSLLSIPGLIVAIILNYAYEPIITDYYEDLDVSIESKMKKIRKEQLDISKQLKELESVKKKVEELEKQERLVSERIVVVKKIVDKRQNPYKVLRYVAENTPNDVWIESLELNDKSFRIIGYSKSWKSIADFLEDLKSSVFFGGNISYSKNPNAKNMIDKIRLEPFVISASIARFR